MVSGLAALIMTMRGNLNGAQVKQLIEQNVQKKSQFNGLVTTGGLIDVDKTIEAVIGGGSATTPVPPPCADKQGREAWCQRYRYFQVFQAHNITKCLDICPISQLCVFLEWL